MNEEDLRLKLPPLPLNITRPEIEVTEQTFSVWDLSQSTFRAIAFLRGTEGGFKVWTRTSRAEWRLRGPWHISKEDAERLAAWFNKWNPAFEPKNNGKSNESSLLLKTYPEEMDGAIGILRLVDGSFRISLMAQGLRRGEARMRGKDGHLLEHWLMKNYY
ncbi:hypothetical protein ACFLUY_01350 [Chloroflexota bacterium]